MDSTTDICTTEQLLNAFPDTLYMHNNDCIQFIIQIPQNSNQYGHYGRGYPGQGSINAEGSSGSVYSLYLRQIFGGDYQNLVVCTQDTTQIGITAYKNPDMRAAHASTEGETGGVQILDMTDPTYLEYMLTFQPGCSAELTRYKPTGQRVYSSVKKTLFNVIKVASIASIAALTYFCYTLYPLSEVTVEEFKGKVKHDFEAVLNL